MTGFGWKNHWPMQFGGKSRTHEVYDALRSVVGEQGTAKDEDSLEGMWRAARAKGMASASRTVDRAAVQVLPSRATDLLPYYETAVGRLPGGDQNDATRRALAAGLWASRSDASAPSLRQQLQALDPRFTLLSIPREDALETHWGRAFEPFDGSEPMNLNGPGTEFPAANESNLVIAVLELGAGTPPTKADELLMDAARALLGDLVSSCAGVRLLGHVGFILDRDPLDTTGFGS